MIPIFSFPYEWFWEERFFSHYVGGVFRQALCPHTHILNGKIFQPTHQAQSVDNQAILLHFTVNFLDLPV